MLKHHQVKILMQVRELEKSMGELYALFALQFPAYATLWQTLVKEEQEHADAVHRLYKMTHDQHALFEEGACRLGEVQSVIDRVQGVCERARLGTCTLLDALTAAYDLENSLVEKDIFRHFLVAPQFSDMLQYLHKGTQRHIQLIKDELDAFEKIRRDALLS